MSVCQALHLERSLAAPKHMSFSCPGCPWKEGTADLGFFLDPSIDGTGEWGAGVNQGNTDSPGRDTERSSEPRCVCSHPHPNLLKVHVCA